MHLLQTDDCHPTRALLASRGRGVSRYVTRGYNACVRQCLHSGHGHSSKCMSRWERHVAPCGFSNNSFLGNRRDCCPTHHRCLLLLRPVQLQNAIHLLHILRPFHVLHSTACRALLPFHKTVAPFARVIRRESKKPPPELA